MRRDRRTALLIGLWAVAAGALGAAAVLVPVRSHAITPTPLDLAVGWGLMLAGLVSHRYAAGASLLTVAGAVWVGVGLAPLAGDPFSEGLLRLSLVPTALLIIAVAALPDGRLRNRTTRAVAALTLLVAAVGAAGFDRYAMLCLGLVACLAALAPGDGRRVGPVAQVQLLLAAGILTVGILATGFVDVGPATLVDLHALVLLAGAGALAWRWGRRPGLRRDAVDLGAALGIGRALGEMVGTGPLRVAFPTAEGGWLDPSGQDVQLGTPTVRLLDESGGLVAVVSPVWRTPPRLDPDARQFLVAAARGAELRATLRSRADQLELSRKRLQVATESERQRFATQIHAGPLRRLDAVRKLVRSADPDSAAPAAVLVPRVDAARDLLLGLVEGLDPASTIAELRPALERLVEAHGGVLRTRLQPDAVVAPGVLRAVWFTCAEAVANVAKHARGSRIEVELTVGDGLRLTVRDDGPGGADPGGSGLSGLADRARSVGGRLTVRPEPTGTVVELVVPATSPAHGGFPLSDDVLSPIHRGPAASRLAT